MPRTRRSSMGGVVYHALSRGNGRRTVFHHDRDYEAFIELLVESRKRFRMGLFAWCLMPNHFHFVVRPECDGELGRWMQWILTSHVRRHHKRYGTDGRLWQGRFKAFPIQEDRHLLTVLRYVERNPLTAALVDKAQHWLWSSLSAEWNRVELDESPVPRPEGWNALVNEPITAKELEAFRESVDRQRPYGSAEWVEGAAERMGLQFTLRPRGRPKTERGHSHLTLRAK